MTKQKKETDSVMRQPLKIGQIKFADQIPLSNNTLISLLRLTK